ncbi:MAG: tungsten ABC transporter substrate-binding protein, partial [Nitrospinota bacterium]
MKQRVSWWPILLCCGLLLLGEGWSAAQTRLRLSTTTSTENSGLLAVLLPPFEKRFRVKVDVIPVGTGKALALARNGDVDVTLVHARSLEDQFVAEGYGVNRRDVMYNDFVLVGPPEDPAGIQQAKSAVEAFQRIAKTQALFLSRGDNSGTHVKEKTLWQEAGITPQGRWYLEAGKGMGATLTMADEKGAYTLSDRGTYLSMKHRLQLPILFAGDPRLFNPYGIIAVNPAKHPHVH